MSAIDDANNALSSVISNLSGPASVSSDAGTVQQHSIPDQIEAANYLAGIAAANSRRRGLRFNRLVPDGTVHTPWRWPHWTDGGTPW